MILVYIFILYIFILYIFILYNMNSYKIILLIIVVVLITLVFVYGRNLVNTPGATMGGFQKSVLMITFGLLLVIFIFMVGILVYAKKNDDNVPIVPQCPDFWEIEETDTGPKCVNVQNLGTCPAASGDEFLSVDFNSGNFTDNCSKYTWANNCNIAWDGLTYGVDNPCITTASTTAALAAETAAANKTSTSIA
jgi:hypothetical protein